MNMHQIATQSAGTVSGVRSCTKDGDVKFNYENEIKVIYNPDCHMINTTIENLNNRQIDVKY
jgi:hypothetical protein